MTLAKVALFLVYLLLGNGKEAFWQFGAGQSGCIKCPGLRHFWTSLNIVLGERYASFPLYSLRCGVAMEASVGLEHTTGWMSVSAVCYKASS